MQLVLVNKLTDFFDYLPMPESGKLSGYRDEFPELREPFDRIKDHLSHQRFVASHKYPLPEALEGSSMAAIRKRLNPPKFI